MPESPYVVVGVDVAKEELEICISPMLERERIKNEVTAFPGFVSKLNNLKPNLIVLEATGGYENLFVLALVEAKLPVVVVNPRHVRDFAKACGILAKTDRIDAAVIAAFGDKLRPPIRPLGEEKYSLLNQLLCRRRQLVDMIAAEKNRLAMTMGIIRKNVEKHLRWLHKELESIENQIKQEIRQSPIWREKERIVSSFKGVGPISACTLITLLPELGQLNRKKISALVGLAPFNRDSGYSKGKRSIFGGRAEVRKLLYMNALVAIRYNPQIRDFYNRLTKQGKPFKVAMTACMHKILIILNTMMKNKVLWTPQSSI